MEHAELDAGHQGITFWRIGSVDSSLLVLPRSAARAYVTVCVMVAFRAVTVSPRTCMSEIRTDALYLRFDSRTTHITSYLSLNNTFRSPDLRSFGPDDQGQ